MKMLRLSVVVALALVSGSALAQGKKPSAEEAAFSKLDKQSGKIQKVRNYVFGGDNLEGQKLSPDGDDFWEIGPAQKTSLIKVREDFLREMVKATE